MAILIVDEPGSRQTLRRFLGRLGHDVIIEARNGESALKVLEEHRGKVRLLLSDLDLPGMDGLGILEAVRTGHRWADLMGFLLMSSDLKRRQIAEIDLATPFPDGHLTKPFKFSQLHTALNHTMYRRNARRDTLLYIGNVGAEFSRIQEALKRHRTHWKRLLHGSTRAELNAAVAAAAGHIGGVLVDPICYSGISRGWLGPFRKTALGSAATVVCLGKSVQANRDIRKYCQIFFEPGVGDLEWDGMLRKISRRTLHAWTLENLATLAKRALLARRHGDARKLANRMLQLDPDSGQAHTLLAESHVGRQALDAGLEHFQKARLLNPCAPHPYLRLLDLLPADRISERKIVAESAAVHCPGHAYIQTRAAAVIPAQGAG